MEFTLKFFKKASCVFLSAAFAVSAVLTTGICANAAETADYDTAKNLLTGAAVTRTTTTPTVGGTNVKCGVLIQPSSSAETPAENAAIIDGSLINTSNCHSISKSGGNKASFRIKFSEEKTVKQIVITTRKASNGDGLLSDSSVPSFLYAASSNSWWNDNDFTEAAITASSVDYKKSGEFRRTVITLSSAVTGKDFKLYIPRNEQLYINEIELYANGSIAAPYPQTFTVQGSYSKEEGVKLSAITADFVGGAFKSVSFYNADDDTLIADGTSDGNGTFTASANTLTPGKTYNVYAKGTSSFGEHVSSNTSVDAFSGFLADITSCKLENGTVTYSASVKNGSGTASPDNAAVIFALYDTDGRLVKVNSESLSLSSGASKDYADKTIGTALSENVYKLKMFVWATDTLSPLGESDVSTVTKQAVISLASDFPSLPFEIVKNSPKCYSISGKNLLEVTAANVFGTAQLSFDLSLDSSKGVSAAQCLNSIKSYSSIESCVLNICDNVYTEDLNSIIAELNTKKSNILIQSKSDANFSWLGKLTDCSFTYSDGLYSCTTAESPTKYLFPVDFSFADKNGMPHPYTLAANIESCKAVPGSFFFDDSKYYVNPFDDKSIENIRLLREWSMAKFDGYTGKMTVLNNLGFFGGCYKLNFADAASSLYVFNSKFYRGKTNTFEVSGKYSAYVINCIAAYPSKDGFNYHSSSCDSLAAEINCTAYDCGVYMLSGATAQKNENASTAHDAIKILRVGGKYKNCNGPIVADVHNTYSISIGCVAEISNTDISFQYASDDTSAALAQAPATQPKYIVDCIGRCQTGLHLDDGSRVKTYILDFDGSINNSIGTLPLSWNDILK